MEVHDGHLPADLYASFLANMPEVCVDVVVEREGRVLLCRRENEPAKGEWFWPGSRLFRGEALEDAVHRVAREELDIEVTDLEQLGANAHRWDTSEQSADVRRHTVVVVYRVAPVAGDPAIALDEQHSAWQWFDGTEPGLHEYVDRYFERYDLPRS